MTADFDEKVNKLFERLGESRVMVLATGAAKQISARSMSVVIYNNRFYFQTDRTFLKYRQLKENSNAALCCENISVEGSCRELGRPLDDRDFCRSYRKHFEGSFNAYSNLDNEVLFEFIPRVIKMWIYENDVPYTEVYDFESHCCHKLRQACDKGE